MLLPGGRGAGMGWVTRLSGFDNNDVVSQAMVSLCDLGAGWCGATNPRGPAVVLRDTPPLQVQRRGGVAPCRVGSAPLTPFVSLGVHRPARAAVQCDLSVGAIRRRCSCPPCSTTCTTPAWGGRAVALNGAYASFNGICSWSLPSVVVHEPVACRRTQTTLSAESEVASRAFGALFLHLCRRECFTGCG